MICGAPVLSVRNKRTDGSFMTFMVKPYCIYGCSVYYIYGQILLHLWLVDLLPLWLEVVTFMVNFYYIYGSYSNIYSWSLPFFKVTGVIMKLLKAILIVLSTYRFV